MYVKYYSVTDDTNALNILMTVNITSNNEVNAFMSLLCH